jgi:hypothetical protein
MWKQNDYFLGNANALTADELAAILYNRVCRCDFSEPGFALLNFGPDFGSQPLRRLMVSLKKHLNQLHEERHGKKLVYTSMGRFDQQVTTKPHRDGGPDESLLILGYEPTPVKSRVSLSDYTKCAFDMGITPTEFLDQLNPMFADGQDALAPYTTWLEAFDNTVFQILVLNNSVLPHDTNENNWLGVLHTAEIITPMSHESRVVNSTMIASVDLSVEEEVSGTEQQEFIATDLVRGAVYG